MNLIEYARMYEAEDRHWWYVGLHELILETIRQESQRVGRHLDIFDAGCGTGRLCQLMLQHGHRVSGCDASLEAVRFCRLREVDGTVQADLNDIELEEGVLDVITSIDVLYHTGIRDDVDVMRRLLHGLRPGGMLILNLVAHEFLRSTHDIAVHTRERYTRQLLCERLQTAGFEIVRASYRVSILFPLIAAYRLVARFLNRPCRDSAVVDSDVALPLSSVNALLVNVVRMENYLLEKFSLPFGSSLFVVARRPDKKTI